MPVHVLHCIFILFLIFSCRIASAQDSLGADVTRALRSPRTTSAAYSSLSDYVQGRSYRARNTLISAIERWQENSFVDACSKFLLALEQLSDSALTPPKIETACGYLSSIDDRLFIRQNELQAELYFWRGECHRLHVEFGDALGQYEKVLRTGYKGEIRQLALMRIAEVADRLSSFETALSAYESLAGDKNNPLAMEASLRRAALLYQIGQPDSALVELARSKSLYSSRRQTSHVVADVILSPFQEVLSGKQTPSAWYFAFDIPPAPENNKQFVLASTQARIALIEGSALTELNHYDSAIQVFDRGSNFLASTKDSTFIAGEKEYFQDGLAFEKAWAYFRSEQYQRSADLFLEVASRDFVQRSLRAPAKFQRRFGDGFYDEAATQSPQQTATEPINILSAELQQLYFNDFPARARYYAGIAYARAGESQKALRILTELSQNKNIVYSERSNFYQALVEFQNGRMYQAEALLEPLGLRQTATGAYASLLLGDIYYRRASYAMAAEYLEFALQYLHADDTMLRAKAQLELGLSLIPLGSWQRASTALQEYLQYAGENTLYRDEALFWLARAYYRSDSIAQAQRTIEKLLRDYPNSERAIDAQYTFAWTLLRQGEFQRAATAFTEVVRKDSITRYAYDALSRQGDALYAIGDLRQALAIYNKAVDRPTFNPYLESRAMFQLGVSRLKSDSARSALNAFNYVITKIPNSDILDRSYYNLALAAYAIRLDERARGAISELEKNFSESPLASRGALLVAEEYEGAGDNTAALREYKRILTTYPISEEFESALFNAIDLLAREKKYQDALELVNNYIARTETAKAIRSRLTIRGAELLIESGKPQSALEPLRTFIASSEKDPLVPNAYYTLGKAFHASGNIDSGTAQFHIVVNSYPESDAAAFSYLHLARIEAKRQQQEQAATFYSSAFDQKYFSSDAAPIAMSEYAALLRNTSRPDSAIKVYDALTERYLIETSAGANAQFEIVEMLVGSGKRDEAISRLERIASARKGEQTGGEARLKIAELYRRQGVTKRALVEFDKARKENQLSNEQLGKSLLGSAEMQIAAGNKRAAKLTLQELLAKRGMSRQHRLRADQLLREISPPKKPTGRTKGGKR